MKFSLIVAYDSKNGIGKDNNIPWHIPEDLKYFQSITMGNGNNAVIMGRITWESIPHKFRPLKKRHNIVISKSNPNYYPNLDSALNAVERIPDLETIFIIGGEMLYNEAINHPNCDKIYVTKIDGDYNCDKFFPIIDLKKFQLVEESLNKKSNNSINYKYQIYTAISALIVG